MKIAILQFNIAWLQPTENLRRLDSFMKTKPVADVYMLPEMFSTGFVMQPKDIREDADSDALEWMKQQAWQSDSAICGSIALKDGEHYFNRFCFVMPDGSVTEYDKRHLFTYSGEQQHYTPGSKRVTVTYQGVRMLLEVCYDLRFPVWSRNRHDYDIILYVANWPTSRIEVWNTLLRARAIENQCYVAGANRIGSDPASNYCGCSAIIDPYGNPIAECGREQEGWIVADIDMVKLNAFRKKFPVLEDSDEFEIQTI